MDDANFVRRNLAHQREKKKCKKFASSADYSNEYSNKRMQQYVVFMLLLNIFFTIIVFVCSTLVATLADYSVRFAAASLHRSMVEEWE